MNGSGLDVCVFGTVEREREEGHAPDFFICIFQLTKRRKKNWTEKKKEKKKKRKEPFPLGSVTAAQHGNNHFIECTIIT